MAKILIVGAGDVGGRSARLLAAQGHAVWALRRQPQPIAGVQAVVADVTRPETLVGLPEDIEFVIVALSPGGGGVAAYEAVYREGTRAVLAALPRSALRHVFWLSSTSVYGAHQGEWITEATPAVAPTPTSAVLLQAEAVAASVGVPCTVLRLGGLYGPGRLRLLRWVEAGRPVSRQPGAWSNRLHVADAAGLVAHLVTLAQAGHALPPVVLGVDGQPTRLPEVLDWIAAQRQLPPVPDSGEVTVDQGKRVAAEAATALGYHWQYPDFRAGYAALCQQPTDGA